MDIITRVLLLVFLAVTPFAEARDDFFDNGEIIESSIGPLQVIASIEKGGGSAVYMVVATRRPGSPMYALKLPLSQNRELTIEATAAQFMVMGHKIVAQRLRGRIPFSPQLITLNDVDDREIVFIMKVGRESLKTRQENLSESLNERIALAYKVFSDLVTGDLKVFSEEGLVHGDVKPANLVLDSDDRYHLIDFDGVRLQGKPSVSRFTTDGFESPESLLRMPYSILSDLYSTAQTLASVLQLGPPKEDYDSKFAALEGKFEKEKLDDETIKKLSELRSFVVASISPSGKKRKEKLLDLLGQDSLSPQINKSLEIILQNAMPSEIFTCYGLFG